jgi:hypothetical protein
VRGTRKILAEDPHLPADRVGVLEEHLDTDDLNSRNEVLADFEGGTFDLHEGGLV